MLSRSLSFENIKTPCSISTLKHSHTCNHCHGTDGDDTKPSIQQRPYPFRSNVGNSSLNEDTSPLFSKKECTSSICSTCLGHPTIEQEQKPVQVKTDQIPSFQNEGKQVGSASIMDSPTLHRVSLQIAKPPLLKKVYTEPSADTFDRKEDGGLKLFENLPTVDGYIQLISNYLDDKISIADDSMAPNSSDLISIFFSISTPMISTSKYIRRLLIYIPCSEAVFLVAFIYINRICLKKPELCGLNIANLHRLLITAIVISSKVIDDETYSMSYYAKVGGVPSCLEMIRLEIAFLKFIDHDISIGTEELSEFIVQLTGASDCELSLSYNNPMAGKRSGSECSETVTDSTHFKEFGPIAKNSSMVHESGEIDSKMDSNSGYLRNKNANPQLFSSM